MCLEYGYLLSSAQPTYLTPPFAFHSTALVLPNLALLYLLKERGALLPGMPIKIPRCLGDLDNLCKFVLNTSLLWPLLIVNFFAIGIKLIVGMYLFATKSLCIGTVANWWFRWWTLSDDHEMTEAIDTELLNESMYVEIAFEVCTRTCVYARVCA